MTTVMRRRRRGLGLGDASLPAGATCTGTFSFLDPFCWGVSFGANLTGQVNTSGSFDTTSDYGGAYPAPPTPVPPPAPAATPDNSNPLVLPPSSGAAAQQTVDQAIAAGDTATKAQNQQFFGNLANNLGACQSTILPALGICDSTIYWTAGAFALLGFVFMLGKSR